MKVGAVNGAWQIVALKVDATDLVIDLTGERERLKWEGPSEEEPTITADLLRQLPLRQIRDMAVSAETGKGELLRAFTVERPPGGWGDDHYKAVAEAYRAARRSSEGHRTAVGRQSCNSVEVGR